MVTRYVLFALALIASGARIAQAQTADEATEEPRALERSIIKQPAEIGSGIEDARPITESKSETPSIKSLQAAYALSKTAGTIREYTAIIAACEEALAAQQAPAVRKYAEQLLAWAANRRGEFHSQEAARLTALGRTEDALFRDRQALADFDTAVANDPTKWKALHNRGVGYALIGRYEDALADLTKAIEQNGTYSNTWFNRAEVRYELGQYEDAAADYSEVIARQPLDFGAVTGRGHAWYRMGELQKALADYHRAVALDPKSAAALINRGDTYRQLGQWAQSAADYRAAIKLDEKFGRAYRAAAWLMATCPDDKFRNSDLAIRAAEQAIDLDGAQDYAYHDTLAAAYASAGKYSEAVAAAEKALAAATDEAKLPVEERLAMYRAGKPYRLSTHVALKPTPAQR